MDEINIYEQSIDDFCPVMAYLDSEPVRFDQDSQRWMVYPESGFEFIYKLDLGSARLDGPLLGRQVRLLIGHNKYEEMCDKTLNFQWENGQWRLVGWTPQEMTFPDLERESFVVPEVMQDSLTGAVRKLGAKLCQEFDFLNEKHVPKRVSDVGKVIADIGGVRDDVISGVVKVRKIDEDWHYVQDNRRRIGSLQHSNNIDEYTQYVADRQRAIERCADELLDGVDCGDEELEEKLGAYFEKILQKYM